MSKGEKIYAYIKMVYFRFNPWVGKISRSRKGQPAPVFLPGKVHGQRNLEGYSPWDCRESDTTERLSSSTLIYHNS